MDARIPEASTHDEDVYDALPLCRHWQSRGLCAQTCSCGHGCAEHHEAGWCSRCDCLAWGDVSEPLIAAPRASRPGGADDWELQDVFDDERFDPSRVDWREVAGW